MTLMAAAAAARFALHLLGQATPSRWEFMRLNSANREVSATDQEDPEEWVSLTNLSQFWVTSRCLLNACYKEMR